MEDRRIAELPEANGHLALDSSWPGTSSFSCLFVLHSCEDVLHFVLHHSPCSLLLLTSPAVASGSLFLRETATT